MGLLWGGVSFDVAKDIPSLAGKVILVTGGNSGLGKASTAALAKYGKPEKIFLAARSAEKAEAAIEAIKRDVPDAAVVPLVLDLASFESIKSAARTFLSQSDRLDILMLNAGIMATPAGLTKEGYEIQFGTNHVGHFLLTKLLLPLLRATAARPEKPDVRVVAVSSTLLTAAPAAGFDETLTRTDGSAVNTWTRYGHSKLANALMAREMARRYPELTCVSVHPGAVSTNLLGPFQQSNILASVGGMLLKPFMASPETGAKNQLWASTSADVKSGAYYVPVGDLDSARLSAKARNDELARKLWEWSEKEVEGQEI